MKNIFVVLAFLFSAMLFSQHQGSIKGTVTDDAMNNDPLLFANVQLKGSHTSYQTNFHGNYEISDVASGTHTLVVRYAGYETQEIQVVVKDAETTLVHTDLAPIQISFDNVVGMDAALKEDRPK